jgi:hypothetical protein
MTHYNKAIMELISEDALVAHLVYGKLTEKWPQINHSTKIRPVNEHRIQIYPDIQIPAHWNEGDVVYIPILGWQKLKLYLFPNRYVIDQLDDPEYRQQWVIALWKAAFKSPTFMFWRVMGRLFLREDWERRGQEKSISPVATYRNVRTETITLEKFGWRFPGSNFDPFYQNYEHEGYLACAYHPATDTLYVRRWERDY